MNKEMINKYIKLLRLELAGMKNLKEIRKIGRKDVLDSNDLLHLLQISAKTLYRWRKSGKISCARIGKKFFFEWKVVMPLLIAKIEKK